MTIVCASSGEGEACGRWQGDKRYAGVEITERHIQRRVRYLPVDVTR
ncbi:MAG: hypothetical protein WAK95_15565 [Desulfobacterales bacterium]